MVIFWPREDDWVWCGPAAVTVLVCLLEVFARRRVLSISVDLFEHADLSVLKESAKSCWTNMGVTAALLLTVDVAMLQTDSIAPRFPVDEEDLGVVVHLQVTYDLLCAVALMYCIWAMMCCVIYLCYVEPLDNKGAVKFFIANPATVGSPALSIVLACIYTGFAVVLWVLGTSGLYNGIAIGVCFTVFVVVTGIEIWDKATFDPSGTTAKALEWQWPSQPEEDWPWFIKLFGNDVKRGNAHRIFVRMSRVLNDAESEESPRSRKQNSGERDGADDATLKRPVAVQVHH